MDSPELINVCATAFLWVFSILLLLAIVMRLITLTFAEKSRGADTAVVAALSVVLPSLFPGTKITRIEEKK
jgi:hypothetical protein